MEGIADNPMFWAIFFLMLPAFFGAMAVQLALMLSEIFIARVRKLVSEW